MQRRIVASFCFVVFCATLLLGVLFLESGDEDLRRRSTQQGLKILTLQQSRAPILDRDLCPLTDTQQQLWGFVYPGIGSLSEEESRIVCSDADAPSDIPCAVLLHAPSYTEHIYPFLRTVRSGSSSLAVHLVGYVNGDDTGAAGLEKAFDKQLMQAGAVSRVTYYVDGTGKPFQNAIPMMEKVESDGALILTLDRSLQQITEDAAENYIHRGAVVIIDVKSGDVLASCSAPALSPENISSQLNDPDMPFNNRAFLAYNVGSVFKPIVAAAALEEGISDFTYTCTGAIEVDGVVFHCNDLQGHGALNMEEAICCSCNPYFIALGLQVGYEKVYGMASALGLGSSAAFADGVVSAGGSLPSPDQIRGDADAANIFFGQGKLTATPLQLARMMAVMAGEGILYPVNLIEGFYEDGVLDDSMTNKGEVKVFSADTAARLRQMLKTVVDRGSGTSAAPNNGGAGGKTGSAQTGRFDDDGTEIVQGWFVGFYPYEDPKYAIAIVAEDSLYGSTAAAPAFRYICNRIFVEKGI